MVMRRRTVSEPVKESIQTEEASLVDTRQSVIEEPLPFEARSSGSEPETIETELPEATDEEAEGEQVAILEEPEIEPEQSGSVYCQNPDGSVMVFDPMSGTWKGVDQ